MCRVPAFPISGEGPPDRITGHILMQGVPDKQELLLHSFPLGPCLTSRLNKVVHSFISYDHKKTV
jgi:hypothetical protein